MKFLSKSAVIILVLTTFSAMAAEWPTPKQGEWVLRGFKFHTGEVMAELRVHYTTVGEPTGEPVLVLHGTTASAASMLTPAFAGELFGPGQPLDARKYYIIIPDALGHGKTSKPSDGLRMKFPRYNYDDMVEVQYHLVKEGLGVRHIRLLIGFSMGGMHAWLWGEKHPDFMDALVPMASQPSEMSSRNWMLRRMLVESIRNDPDWKNGDYTTQPHALKVASVFYGIATNGGTLAYQKMAPTREKADKVVNARLAAPVKSDANDVLYQWESSSDYNASPELSRIEAMLLAINSADDERNPPETGIMERELKHVKNGRLYLIPGSEITRGHGTVVMAKFYKQQLEELLQNAPRRMAQ